MSWLTPFYNTIIRFKLGNSNNGGGITEETLNSKLAAFYTATETKILNLVNTKLATFALQSDLSALSAKVTTNTNDITELTNKINNLPTTSAPLSYIKGYITMTMTDANEAYDVRNGYYLGIDIDNLQVNNASIPISSLKQYIVNFTYTCDISKWKDYKYEMYAFPVINNLYMLSPPTTTEDRLVGGAVITLIPNNQYTIPINYTRGDVTTWNIVLILSKSLNEILQVPSAITNSAITNSAITNSATPQNTLIVESYS